MMGGERADGARDDAAAAAMFIGGAAAFVRGFCSGVSLSGAEGSSLGVSPSLLKFLEPACSLLVWGVAGAAAAARR